MDLQRVLYRKYLGIERRDWFLIIVFLTIIISRLFLWFVPGQSWIFNDDMHHIYYGLLLLLVVVVLDRQWHHEKLLVPFSIAVGLVVDELVFLFPGVYGYGKDFYFGFPSMFGMFVLVFLIVIFRSKILMGLEAIIKSQ